MSARRIAIVAPNYHPQTCGVGDHSMRLAAELSRLGFEVRIFTREPAHPHPAALGMAVAGAAGGTTRELLASMEAKLVEWGPESVLLQYTAQAFQAGRFGSQAFAGFARRLVACGVRVVLLAHELFVPWSIRPDLALAAIAQRVALARLAGSCNRLAVTTTTRIPAALRWARLAGYRGGVQVVPVGANAAPVAREPTAHPQVGTFSTAANGKRFDVVLEAFARIGERWPSAELVLLGDLLEPRHRLGRELLEAVRLHQYTDRIRLPGRLPLDEVAKEISQLRVFLFPMDTGANTRSGTLPTALGSGIPVVAVRGAETDEGFVDGENVLFANGLDGQSFAEATLRLLEDGALADCIGEGGRRLFEERLAWPRIAAQVAAICSWPTACCPDASTS